MALNCAAVTESLLESELFGHKRGAFTDARENRPGLLVQAHGGTVFLDEIGDMPAGMQAKLLRAIESRTVRPVGSDTEIPIDVRFVAATNRDLESDAEEGRFRHDLFFRINVIQIAVPPLRARGNDVLLLAQHFLERAAARNGKGVVGFSPAGGRAAAGLHLAGQRARAAERRRAGGGADRVRAHRPRGPARAHPHPPALAAGGGRRRSRAACCRCTRWSGATSCTCWTPSGGNKTVAARILGFDRRTMYRKLERFER